MKKTKICVIGLGYVGLPLARLFSTQYKTIGFDMNQRRVDALMAGHDVTLEVSDELLQDAIKNHGFKCTADVDDIRDCNFYVVAVPTPVDENNTPDLTPLYGASTTVGKVISKGDVVVYESTVYPGVTEDECLPVVEKISGLKFNVDFFAGYSPERINPGDKLHTVEYIKKVTSGSTPEIGVYVNEVYASVISAGTHLAPTMKVAEAAKRYARGGYDVIVDGIVGPWFLEPWKALAQEDYEVHYIVLRASKKETMKRAVERSKLDRKTNIELVETMWEQFSGLGVYESNVIDTTTFTIKDTVSAIKERVACGTSLLS